MENIIKKQINLYIKLLSELDINDFELKEWVPNCIDCLKFAINNEQLLNEKIELYKDTLYTIDLLYSWIIGEETFAYIQLSHKFRNYYTPEKVGEALKTIVQRLKKINEIEKINNDLLISFTDSNNNFKSTSQIFNELSQKFEELI